MPEYLYGPKKSCEDIQREIWSLSMKMEVWKTLTTRQASEQARIIGPDEHWVKQQNNSETGEVICICLWVTTATVLKNIQITWASAYWSLFYRSHTAWRCRRKAEVWIVRWHWWQWSKAEEYYNPSCFDPLFSEPRSWLLDIVGTLWDVTGWVEEITPENNPTL